MCRGVVEGVMLTSLFALFLNSDVFFWMLPVTLHCWERSQCLSFLEVFGSRGYSAGLWKTCTAPGSHSRHYKHTAACITLLHSEFHIAHLQRGSPAFSALRADPGDAARSWTAHLLDGSAAQRLHHGARQLCTPLVLLLLHRQPHQESGCVTPAPAPRGRGSRPFPSQAACAWLTLDGGGEGTRLPAPVHVPLPCCSAATWGSTSSPFCHLLHIGFSHVNY